MDLEMLKTILRTIFIEWQAFGFILGVGVPLLLYKLTKKDSAETLESSRKKEFDKNPLFNYCFVHSRNCWIFLLSKIQRTSPLFLCKRFNIFSS